MIEINLSEYMQPTDNKHQHNRGFKARPLSTSIVRARREIKD